MQFRSPDATEHIVPALLKEIWETHNEKDQILWEMGQQGSVSGDAFVKIAYEAAQPEEYDPETGVTLPFQPARVRILPLNSAYCFADWHPHDRNKLLRFKLKYRFYGTTAEGTRSVFTYTEIITDGMIEEYVNDEMIDQRPNPIGIIPVVHIANFPVSGSPWGLSDIQDIISANREYNEKATDISDIINYHAAPVTVITGAKLHNMEKGARKVWAGLPKDANVFNLVNNADLGSSMQNLEMLKRYMHEATGVPETALGQAQPVSNTSGVALAIQYQPAMNKYNIKKVQYSAGLKKINALILRTIFTHEPYRLAYDPDTQGIIEDGQSPVLDGKDPIIYQTECHWPPPLPVDTLIKLNEITQKMSLGLESKRGALADLGNEFPDDKMYEIFQEMQQDALETGAQQLVNAYITSAIQNLTGINPASGENVDDSGDGKEDSNSTDNSSGNSVTLPGGVQLGEMLDVDDFNKITTEIVTLAFGPRANLRRNPDTD